MIKYTPKHTIIYLVADKTRYSQRTITLNFGVQLRGGAYRLEITVDFMSVEKSRTTYTQLKNNIHSY